MNVILDTNVLTRLAQASHPKHTTALDATRRLLSIGRVLCIVPQNLYEFWAVATRPIVNNGLGLTVQEAKVELDRIKQSFILLRDPPTLPDEWEKLIVTYDCKGKPSHDARIVAAMQIHGVLEFITFDRQDFTRFAGIRLLDPDAVSTGAAP